MIEVNHLVKSFGAFHALDDLTMTLPTGSIYGLVGPNGAGKSTLLRHLCGVYRQDAGEITLDGAAIYENPAVKEKVFTIPDDLYSFGTASTRDMAKFYAGFYPKFDWERYERLRGAFPAVNDRAPIRRLSKGMQKQSAFWLGLCCRPECLLLDEPVDGLDPVMRRQVWSLLMGDVSESGTTVLVSSHNLRELEDVCDRVGILSRGKVLLERSLSELQGGIVKIQAAFPLPEAPKLPEGLEVLHTDQLGRIFTYIVRGRAEEVKDQFATLQPILLEALPLTLEEIFIYELGGEDYAVHEILL